MLVGYIIFIFVLAFFLLAVDSFNGAEFTGASVPFGFCVFTCLVYFTPWVLYYAYLGFTKGNL